MKIACIDFSPQSRLALQDFVEYSFSACREIVGTFDTISLVPVSPEDLDSKFSSDICIVGPGFNFDQISWACCTLRRNYFKTASEAGCACTRCPAVLVLVSHDREDSRAEGRLGQLGGEVFHTDDPPLNFVKRILELVNQSRQAQPSARSVREAESNRFSSADSSSLLPVVSKSSYPTLQPGRIKAKKPAKTRHQIVDWPENSSDGLRGDVPSGNRFNVKDETSIWDLASFGESCARGLKKIKEALEFPFFDDDPRKNSYLTTDRADDGFESGWYRVRGRISQESRFMRAHVLGYEANRTEIREALWHKFIN